MADTAGIKIELPRLTARQRNNMGPSKNVEEYYKEQIFSPFLNDMKLHLTAKFGPHQESAFSLSMLLPQNIGIKFVKNLDLVIRNSHLE